jgi:flagellar hook protein FlgE
MSHEVGHEHDGGFDYLVTVNGLTVTGWRKGTHADVEKHAKNIDQYSTHRAAGFVPKRNADGSFRLNLSGKVKKLKKQPQQEAKE